MGGGIYWCEQKKESKNTCSNAPGSVLALKLFKATNDSSYFEKGKKLYDKRDDIAKKDQKREAQREFKIRNL